MAMGLALQKPPSALQQPLLALQQPLGLALADQQACHLLQSTHALLSRTQNLTASPLLVDHMLRISLSEQA